MAPYSERNKTQLVGKCVAITGANSGIGKVTAMDLSKRGARVLLLCRDKDKSEVAADEIRKVTNNEVVFYKLDLASLQSVRECAEEIKQKEEKIDILINNAGVAMCPKWTTKDGYEMQFGTNHLGHFLLTELLLPLLKKSATTGFHPRIVILASLAHKQGAIKWDDINWEKSYDSIKAYNMSKLANVMHGQELARRLEGTGITVYSLHPGVVNTEVFRHAEKRWYSFMLSMAKPFFKSPLEGAQTTIYCAIEDKIKNDSGKYYSDCKEKRAVRRALNENDQKRLWKLSKEMVGLSKN